MRASRLDIVRLLPVLYYADVIYVNAYESTLKSHDAVRHSVVRFITCDSFRTHQYTSYEKASLT